MDPLFEAILNNDLRAVKLLLVSSPGLVKAKDEHGRTPLMVAVIKRNTQFARLLIDLGSEIDKRDFQGRCALHLACRNNDIEMAEMLISQGAAIDITDKGGCTPLEASLLEFGEDSGIVKLLQDSLKTKLELASQLEPFIWCLVGNIVERRYFGEMREISRGTKKFASNTKVYCFPALWGDGYEEIQVIGKLRNRKNLGVIITSSKYITNWRLQKVYQPYVVKTMRERGGWDADDQSKSEIEEMLEWLPDRTEHVVNSSL